MSNYTKSFVGFTGTSRGMTPNQLKKVGDYLESLCNLSPIKVRHGDCLGADAEFHRLSVGMNIPIHIHPPINPKARAWCEPYEFMHEPEDYLVRDRAIVDLSTILIAAPRGMSEELRSGTWYTVRYAQRCERICHVFWPNGKVDFMWKRAA